MSDREVRYQPQQLEIDNLHKPFRASVRISHELLSSWRGNLTAIRLPVLASGILFEKTVEEATAGHLRNAIITGAATTVFWLTSDRFADRVKKRIHSLHNQMLNETIQGHGDNTT